MDVTVNQLLDFSLRSSELAEVATALFIVSGEEVDGRLLIIDLLMDSFELQVEFSRGFDGHVWLTVVECIVASQLLFGLRWH